MLHGLQRQAWISSLPVQTHRGDDPEIEQVFEAEAKGVGTKSLVAFGLEMAKERDDALGTPHAKTVHQVSNSLMNIYLSFEVEPFDPDFTSSSHHDLFVSFEVLNHVALARDDCLRWRMKPKLHLMQELGEYMVYQPGNTRGHWDYADESSVGDVAPLAQTEVAPRKEYRLP